MDLVTSLPETQRGHDAVFSVVDRFSKLVTFVLCVISSTAVDVAQLFFEHVVCKFGMPKKIVSDRDPRFLSDFWTALMARLETKVGLSSSYHPQIDGQTERFHRSVE